MPQTRSTEISKGKLSFESASDTTLEIDYSVGDTILFKAKGAATATIKAQNECSQGFLHDTKFDFDASGDLNKFGPITGDQASIYGKPLTVEITGQVDYHVAGDS